MPRHQFITFGKIDPFEASKPSSSVTNVYQCPDCNYSTPNRSHLRRHITGSHMRDFQLHCSVCGKGFVLRIQLQQHVLKHNPVKTEEKKEIGSKCNICKELFPSLPALEEHKKSQHRSHCCKWCSFSAKNLKTLRNHLQTHSSQLHRCEFCNKAFLQKVHLKIHLRVHTEERPYVCTFCGKAFTQRSNLEAHNKKLKKCRFLCKICNQNFLRDADLQKHLRIHAQSSNTSAAPR